MRKAWLHSLVLGATNGLCAAGAGLVPLSFGLSIAQPPVQLVVGACVLVGFIVGWFVPTRGSLVLVAVVSGMTSYAMTREAITILYPPKLSG